MPRWALALGAVVVGGGVIALMKRKGGAADSVVALALEQVGLRESGDNTGPEIEKFTGGRAELWCGHFVAWLFRTVGAPLPGDRVPFPGPGGENPRAGVTSTLKLFKEIGKFIPPTGTPAPGDIVFYGSRGAGDTIAGPHVGLIVNLDGPFNESVEGNTSQRVDFVRVRRDSPRILGYGRWL